MSAFHHEAVFYDDREQYLAGTLPDIRQALAGDGAVLVAVGEDKRALLEERSAPKRTRWRSPTCWSWAEIPPASSRPGVTSCARPPGPIVGIGEPVWPGAATPSWSSAAGTSRC